MLQQLNQLLLEDVAEMNGISVEAIFHPPIPLHWLVLQQVCLGPPWSQALQVPSKLDAVSQSADLNFNLYVFSLTIRICDGIMDFWRHCIIRRPVLTNGSVRQHGDVVARRFIFQP